jgi:hypothetical protein
MLQETMASGGQTLALRTETTIATAYRHWINCLKLLGLLPITFKAGVVYTYFVKAKPRRS